MSNETMKIENWFEKFSNKLKKLDFSTAFIIELACYFISGFIIGFLFKNFWRYLIFLIITTTFGLWVLEHFDFITINYSLIKEFWGVSKTTSLSDVTSVFLEWIKVNFAQSISFLIGFFISYKFI